MDMTSPITRADAAKKRNEGGDWYKTNDTSGYTTSMASPKPRVSNISCLTGEKNSGAATGTPTRGTRDDESDFVKLCREGGHKGLLQIQENTRSEKPVDFKRNGGDWYYTEEKGARRTAVKKGNEKYEKDLAKAHVANSETRDSDYVKRAKAGGDPNLLKISENKPGEQRTPSSKINPIWCGGEGNEAKTTPGGKRVLRPKEQGECPFAKHF